MSPVYFLVQFLTAPSNQNTKSIQFLMMHSPTTDNQMSIPPPGNYIKSFKLINPSNSQPLHQLHTVATLSFGDARVVRTREHGEKSASSAAWLFGYATAGKL